MEAHVKRSVERQALREEIQRDYMNKEEEWEVEGAGLLELYKAIASVTMEFMVPSDTWEAFGKTMTAVELKVRGHFVEDIFPKIEKFNRIFLKT